MKTLELNNYGVQEMNTMEMTEVDGGLVVAICVGILLFALVSGCGATKAY